MAQIGLFLSKSYLNNATGTSNSKNFDFFLQNLLDTIKIFDFQVADKSLPKSNLTKSVMAQIGLFLSKSGLLLQLLTLLSCPKLSFLQYLGLIPTSYFLNKWVLPQALFFVTIGIYLSQNLLFLNVGIETS